MVHGESLAQTIEATQRSIEERLCEAMRPHREPGRPRDNYAATDTFLAATSRHLAAVEAVLLGPLRHGVPDGAGLCREYVLVARALERTLALMKARLYGNVHAAHLKWPQLWASARAELDGHNEVERRLVAELIKYGEATQLDGLARKIFDAETHGPTRPHPVLPHTGLSGLVARRIWAVADRFWDSAEGRVIPEPVHPARHRHDSLIAQYLVADPKFDADATILEHRPRPRAGERE